MFGLFAPKGPFNAKMSLSGDNVEVKAGENLLQAALSQGLAFPHNCRVGSCGECRCKLVKGKIKPLSDFSYVLDGNEIKSGMILACQTSLRSDVEIEVKFDTPPKALSQPKTIEGIISSVKLLTHDIQEVSIKLNEPIPGYLAGQYAELSIPGRIEKPRSYSFATAPDNEIPGSVKFYIRHVPDGEFTSWLHGESRESHAVKVTGPYGSFWLRESDAPIICIAGGSGMAPIKALLEQLSSQGFNRRVDYLFGARTQADLYCIDDMKKIKQQGNGHFNFIPVLSREPEGSDWEGLRGNITDFILPSVSADTRNSQAYLCGPPGMIDSSIETLISAGVQKENIFYDKFLDSSHSPKR